jgi:pimeloyl-ACP methyl ester carboxylesterase
MIKDCGLCVIKDAGHWSFAEKPVEVNAILRSFIP